MTGMGRKWQYVEGDEGRFEDQQRQYHPGKVCSKRQAFFLDNPVQEQASSHAKNGHFDVSLDGIYNYMNSNEGSDLLMALCRMKRNTCGLHP